MSGDTTSSDMTWAHAACSVDKLDKTAEDGAANDPAASDLVRRDQVGRVPVSLHLVGRDFGRRDFGRRDFGRRDLNRQARPGCALATREITEYVGAAHEATADAKAAADVVTDALFSLPAVHLPTAVYRTPHSPARPARGGCWSPGLARLRLHSGLRG